MRTGVVRVVTLNCLWRGNARARLRAIAAEVERCAADVVCLQELVWGWNAHLVRSLTPSYPFIAYHPAPLLNITGGLVTLSRHPILAQAFTVYRARGRLPTRAIADWLLRKGWLTTSIQLPTQKPIVVINTHLLANYDEDWSASNRYAQQLRSELDQLVAALQEIDRTHAVIVAGDLNVPADSQLFADFVREAGLVDGYEPADSRPATVQGGFAVDHILVRPPADAHATVEARTVFDTEMRLADGRWSRLSDHNGVEATVRFG